MGLFFSIALSKISNFSVELKRMIREPRFKTPQVDPRDTGLFVEAS